MTFSIEQALAEFFDNSGGGGICYGGTCQSAPITGNPTGGSGTGSSYPAGGNSGAGTSDAESWNLVYDPKTGKTVEIVTGEELVLNLGSTPPIVVGEEMVLDLNSPDVVHGPELVFDLQSGTMTVEGAYPDEHDEGEPGHNLTVEYDPIVIIKGDPSGADKAHLFNLSYNSTLVGQVLVGTSGADYVTGHGWILGADGADTLNGGAGSDRLEGGNGNDRLDGGAGEDVLTGGNGADVMAGGAGNDVYFVENVGDVVFELGNGGTDTVHTLVDFNIAAWAIENVVLDGDADLKITANCYDNVLTGNSGNNTILAAEGNDLVKGGGGNDSLMGGDGNDTVLGGTGNDIVYGGAGADHLEGGSGNDTVSYFGATGGVTVKLWANSASGDIAQGDAISGFENVSGGSGGDWLEGNNDDNVLDGCGGGDLLLGFGGNDLLFGREGDDTLIADWGTDILEGGSGNDLFAIWATTSHAIINDFAKGDHIQLSTNLFAGFAALRAAAVQSGDDVVIARPGLDITLKHVQLASLAAGDFQFV